MRRLPLSWLLGACVLGQTGCDDGAVDTADNAGRCQIICNAADECTGQDNSTDCRQECVDNSEDDTFESKVEDCAQCIEREDGCLENARDCAQACAGVVSFSST
jgi:hypothetical protein